MTYSSGAGDYNALMAAVLAHAVTDGWTTTAGNWPISKGIVRGVDWSTYTVSEADRTALGGASTTVRYLRLGIGTSTANATSNAASTTTCATCANMHYAFTSWHIFSDPTVSDHIHVVANFSNGINGDCYLQFSFGELDAHGMTHTGVVYATASTKRGYSVSNLSAANSLDWNGGCYGKLNQNFTGRERYGSTTAYQGLMALVYIIDPTVSPVPAGWPVADVLQGPDTVLNCLQPDASQIANISPAQRLFFAGTMMGWSAWAQFTTPQPYSGALSMAPLPFWLLQNTSSSAQTMFLGSFPNVRFTAMNLYSPQDIVTYGSDEWVIFPMLRSTPWSQMQLLDVVSSGLSGYAFKKVP